MKSNSNTYSDKSMVLLCSGGVDSAVIAYRYREHVRRLLFIDYGQPAVSEERQATQHISDELGIELQELTLPLHTITLSDTHQGIVPERNLIFVALACHFAAVMDVDLVAYGAIYEDRWHYVDCRPEWLRLLRRTRHAQQLGMESHHPKIPEVVAPLITWTKEEIIDEAKLLGIDLSAVWSCYSPSAYRVPCGQCASCQSFIKAMEQNDKRRHSDAP